MKTLSYIALISAAVTLILAFIARFMPEGRLIFKFHYYLSGTGLLLLASISFAVHYLINLKSK